MWDKDGDREIKDGGEKGEIAAGNRKSILHDDLDLTAVVCEDIRTFPTSMGGLHILFWGYCAIKYTYVRYSYSSAVISRSIN